MMRALGVAGVRFALCLGVLVRGLARADSIQLEPAKDNTLYQADQAVSNGAGQHFFAGTTVLGSVRRGLISFDVAGNVPVGSIIQSVTLRLHVSRAMGADAVVELHRTSADWGEGASAGSRGEGGGAPAGVGDVTWLDTFWDDSGSAPTWDNPGGDFEADASAGAIVGGIGFYAVASTVQLVADVQLFLDAPALNFGWVLMARNETAFAIKRFDSRESSNSDLRPRLTVEFTPPLTTTHAQRPESCSLRAVP